MIKKKFFLLLFFIFCFNAIAEQNFKIIVTVNNHSITNIDLEKELKILKIINKKENFSNEYIKLALNNLIEEKIKLEEIKNQKINDEQKIIDQYFYSLIKSLNLDKKKINENDTKIIKNKIRIDKLWNEVIIQTYGWKINVNMDEIEKKIKDLNIKETKEIQKLKDKLIYEERNKKLSVYSKYHLITLKNQTLINFF